MARSSRVSMTSRRHRCCHARGHPPWTSRCVFVGQQPRTSAAIRQLGACATQRAAEGGGGGFRGARVIAAAAGSALSVYCPGRVPQGGHHLLLYFVAAVVLQQRRRILDECYAADDVHRCVGQPRDGLG